MRLGILCAAILLLAVEAEAGVAGYMSRRAGNEAFYVDKKHQKGVAAIWKGDWAEAVNQLEGCLAYYQQSARDGLLYRDSVGSNRPPDSMFMYDPRYNSVRYALAVANGHLAACALQTQNLVVGDSLTQRALYCWQHVRGLFGVEVVGAFTHLGRANMARRRASIAESFARRAVNCADMGLTQDDPVRADAYLGLGEVYLAAGKPYDAESPLTIATDVADTGSTRRGDTQQECRELVIKGRCLLAACYRMEGQPALADSLDSIALQQLESAKKPLNLPQTDSLLEQYVNSVQSSGHADEATALSDRVAKVRARREKAYPLKGGGGSE